MRGGGYAWATAADAVVATEGLDAAEPLVGCELDAHVGLGGELGLVEGQDCLGVLTFRGQRVDVYVIPLHGDEL